MNKCGLLCCLSLLFACSKADNESPETGHVDTERPDTEGDSAQDTGTPSFELVVFPSELVVDVGAQWTMQAVAGAVQVPAIFSSSDSAVLSVGQTGQLQALAVGEVEVTASWEGAIAQAQVKIQEVGDLQVRVFAAEDGAALSDARVLVEDQLKLTDDEGLVSFSGLTGASVDIVVYGEIANVYTPALFMDVVPRDLALPLRLRNGDDLGRSDMSGSVDLSGTLLSGPEEKAAGLVTLGLAAPSFQQGALFFPLEQLFSANRTLSIEGISVDLPGNLFLRDYGESWQGTAHEGPVSVWAFGGPVPKSGMASGLNGFAEVLAFLVPHFDAFNWTWSPNLEASDAVPIQVDIRPELEFDERIEVQMPIFPDGLPADSNALLISLSGDMEGGPVLTGMGQGKLNMNMSRVRPELIDGAPGHVLGIGEIGGVGNGGPQTLALAPVENGIAAIESWQEFATMDHFDRETKIFSLSTDPGADFTRLHIRSLSGPRRDVYLPSGVHSRELPTEGPAMGYGSTKWTVLSVETLGESYESLLANGGLAPSHLQTIATTSARTTTAFTPSQVVPDP
jgi:hypothetical protein